MRLISRKTRLESSRIKEVQLSISQTKLTTVPLKSELPPSRETCLVSHEGTGSTNTLHSSVFEICIKTSVSHRLIIAVDAIVILISYARVLFVYYKFSSVHQCCFIYIGQTFFCSSQTCLHVTTQGNYEKNGGANTWGQKACERIDHQTLTHFLFTLVNIRHHAMIMKPRLTFYSNL